MHVLLYDSTHVQSLKQLLYGFLMSAVKLLVQIITDSLIVCTQATAQISKSQSMKFCQTTCLTIITFVLLFSDLDLTSHTYVVHV